MDGVFSSLDELIFEDGSITIGEHDVMVGAADEETLRDVDLAGAVH